MGQWGLLSLTYDGATFRLYVNGAMAGEAAVRDFRGNVHDLLIGAGEWSDPSGAPQRSWLGEIDDFRLYNRALTEAEVKQLYNAQK